MSVSSVTRSSDSASTLYTAFSIITAYCLQALFIPSIQTDLRAVVSVSGFIASLIFVFLSLVKPEERIADTSVRRHLRKNNDFLRFIVGSEILFRGWKLREDVLVHEWRHQISDRIKNPPVSSASVPTPFSRSFLYTGILVILLGDLLLIQIISVYALDQFSLLIQILFTIGFFLGLYWIGNYFRFRLGRYLIEYSILKDYMVLISENQEFTGLGFLIEYSEPEDDERKTLHITLESLNRAVAKMEELVALKLWSRFGYIFERLEPFMLHLMEIVISERGYSDFIDIWSRDYVEQNLKRTKHALTIVSEVYEWWNGVSKRNNEPNEEEKITKEEPFSQIINYQDIYELSDINKLFNLVHVDEISEETSTSLSRVLNVLIENSDIRTEEIIENLLSQIMELGETIVDEYVNHSIELFVRFPNYLQSAFKTNLEDWVSRYGFTEKTAQSAMQKILEDPGFGGSTREAILSDTRKHSTPSFDNSNWEIYNDFMEQSMNQIHPLLQVLLNAIENDDLAKIHDKIFDTILIYAPEEMWKNSGINMIYLLIDNHQKAKNRLTERALLGILNSSNERIVIETTLVLSKLKRAGTHRIAHKMAENLLSANQRLRIAAARTLVSMSQIIEPNSLLHRRILCGLEDPERIVRKHITTLDKKIRTRKSK
jgi:hypothetical protein